MPCVLINFGFGQSTTHTHTNPHPIIAVLSCFVVHHVAAPGWFGKIWAIMKPMLAADFRKKVHMIKENKLPEFFAEGFEAFLPDDVSSGKAPTAEMVQDYVTYRKHIEASRKK